MIEVTELRKRYGGTRALDGMTFTVRPGQVTGFVGPNGAGKSTTMRIILGLDAADSGLALIGGQPYRTLRRPLTHVGSLLDAAALQPGRSARNHLLWLACSQGLPARRADEVAALTGLQAVIRRKAGGYSLGMRQRLGIAAALLGDPPALMLDEPFNGMDPEGIVWMRGFLRALAAEGRAVLVSSHLMSELETLLTEGGAGHLVVAGRGRVIADTSVADLLAAASGDRVRVATPAHAAAAAALTRAGAQVAATTSGLRGGKPFPRTGGGRPDRCPCPVQRGEPPPGGPRRRLPGPYPRRGGVQGGDALMTAPYRSGTVPYRSGVTPGRDGFALLLRAEWVKFRSVRGWVIAMIAAAAAIAVLGLAPGEHGSCGTDGPGSACTQPLGPGGEAVTDSFYFVHRSLAGDGSITARVTSLAGQVPSAGDGSMRAGLVPWAKAGIIVKAGTGQGSAYAAVMSPATTEFGCSTTTPATPRALPGP